MPACAPRAAHAIVPRACNPGALSLTPRRHPPSPSCSAANSLQQKLYNWSTLNSKLFKRLGFQLTREEQTQ